MPILFFQLPLSNPPNAENFLFWKCAVMFATAGHSLVILYHDFICHQPSLSFGSPCQRIFFLLTHLSSCRNDRSIPSLQLFSSVSGTFSHLSRYSLRLFSSSACNSDSIDTHTYDSKISSHDLYPNHLLAEPSWKPWRHVLMRIIHSHQDSLWICWPDYDAFPARF